MARRHPELKFAYSRPGFVTFKKAQGPALEEDFELHSVFARAYGLSVGRTDKKAQTTLEERIQAGLDLAVKCARPGEPLTLHLWERDQHTPGEEPAGFVPGVLAGKIVAELERRVLDPAFSGLFQKGTAPRLGALVFDWVIVDETEWWFGCHRHSVFHSSDPGGFPALSLPERAPSRAYLKLEEGLRWSGVRVSRGDVAVEIGSAPGGASFALLERGLKVVGIDPGVMSPEVLQNGDFIHLAKPVASVLREELPERVDWLLLDMNVSPSITLFQVDRLVSRMQESLLGVFLTLKLNDWKLAAEIPAMLDHVKAMGMSRVRARQLAHNRQEIFVFGLTRKGLTRASS